MHVDAGGTLNWGTGMLDTDPLFADAPGGDHHLTHSSPCRDTGDGSAAGLPEVDFEGDPRAAQGGVATSRFGSRSVCEGHSRTIGAYAPGRILHDVQL